MARQYREIEGFAGRNTVPPVLLRPGLLLRVARGLAGSTRQPVPVRAARFEPAEIGRKSPPARLVCA